LQEEAVRAGVEFLLGTNVDAELVLSGRYDGVIVATGAEPVVAELPGAMKVLSPVEAIERAEALGAAVAIFDEDGGSPGAGLAAHLAAAGKRVELLTPFASLAHRITQFSRLALVPRLVERHVRISLARRALRMEAKTLIVADVFGGAEERIEGIDTFVHARPGVARTALYEDLAARGYDGALLIVGDAHAPRGAFEAIWDGKFAGTTVCAPQTPELRDAVTAIMTL
jgi:hypothetical protein